MAKLLINIIYLVLFFEVCFKGVSSESLENEIQTANSTDEKIVGGTEAVIQSYPYQCYLLLSDGRDNFECGGSILNEYYVLTAAHCLSGMRTINVRIASTNKFFGGRNYTTTTFYSHPLYDHLTKDYDVGIINIQEGMYLDGIYARAITLVGTGNDPQNGTNLVITGWGNTQESGTSPEILQVTSVPVVSREDCNAAYNGTITSRMICAGTSEGGRDTCQGDSGGPAVLSSNGRLAGITSFGIGCGRPGIPGVYTRVGQITIRTYIYHMTGV